MGMCMHREMRAQLDMFGDLGHLPTNHPTTSGIFGGTAINFKSIKVGGYLWMCVLNVSVDEFVSVCDKCVHVCDRV